MQAAGTRIGRYELLEKLGEGGMAEVWKGRNVSIGLIVAIKVLLKHFAHDNDLQQRFLNEGRIQARLRHPNIVSVFDAYSEDGTSYLVMDFVEGETLEGRLRQHAHNPLSVPEVLSISYDILAALEYAHTLPDGPIVHRDVKPSNILLDNEGRARLADFGIAVALNEDRKTKAGLAPGSIHYMSPEQIQTPRSIDRRSDIYSFGCVLYEMLTGNPPFVSDTDSDFKVHQAHVYDPPEPLRKRNPQVPFEFEWIVLKALNKDRETRFSSAKEMATVLKEAAAKGALEMRAAEKPAAKVAPERRATQVEEIAPAKRRTIPWKPLLAAVAVLVVAGGLLRAFWPHSSSGTAPQTPPENKTTIIKSVKFFPYEGSQLPAEAQRKYQANFRAGKVTGIGWEISFKNTEDADFEAHWYSEGSEQAACETKDHLDSLSFFMGLSHGCATNWAPGPYRVDFFADGKKIGSGEFAVNPAPRAGAGNAPASNNPAADDPPPTAQPTSLQEFLVGRWSEEGGILKSQTEYSGDGTFEKTLIGSGVSYKGTWQIRKDDELWFQYTWCSTPTACTLNEWSHHRVKIIDHDHLATSLNPYDGTPVYVAQRMISY
jgi:serine/threonine protein kinase